MIHSQYRFQFLILFYLSAIFCKPNYMALISAYVIQDGENDTFFDNRVQFRIWSKNIPMLMTKLSDLSPTLMSWQVASGNLSIENEPQYNVWLHSPLRRNRQSNQIQMRLFAFRRRRRQNAGISFYRGLKFSLSIAIDLLGSVYILL